MCRMKSAIILKDRVFIPDYDSHTEMLEETEPHESALEAERSKLRIELENEYQEKLKAAEKEAVSKTKAKLEKMKEELAGKDAGFEKRLAEETEKAKAEAAKNIEEQFKGQLDKLASENSSLRKKADAASNAAVQKFSVHFELFQKEGQLLISLLGEIAEGDTTLADKLRDGIGRVADMLKKGANEQ